MKTFILTTKGVQEVLDKSVFCSVCGYVDCVCKIRVEHLLGCTFRTAMLCPVGIECDHGYDVCPICDPCNCADLRDLMEYGGVRTPAVLTLRGSTPSKKNEYRRKAGGKGMYRPAGVVAEIDSLTLQARSQWKGEPMEQAHVDMQFVVRDGRSDLDSKQTAILDVLVKAGVLRNDSIAHVRDISATAVIMPMEEESVRITLL